MTVFTEPPPSARFRAGVAIALLALAVGFAGACAEATLPARGASVEQAPARSGAASGADAGASDDDDDDLVNDEPVAVSPPKKEYVDYTAASVRNAAEVLRSMQPDFRACYKKRLKVVPRAHGSITIDVVIGPAGAPQTVETTGGAILGDEAMACIIDRVKRASFLAPYGGGTLHLSVPFQFRAVPRDAGAK